MTSEKISLRSSLDSIWREHARCCPERHPGPYSDAACVDRFRALAKRVRYRDWEVLVHDLRGIAFVQITAPVEDSINGQRIETNSRPVALCEKISDGFFVDLAFELIKELELHESAEAFRFDGRAVYYPHTSEGVPVQEVRSMRSSETRAAAGSDA